MLETGKFRLFAAGLLQGRGFRFLVPVILRIKACLAQSVELEGML